jgi:uncharacterized protein YidB (DUF937 family)
MSPLSDILGGRSRRGASPLTLGLLGLLAYRTLKGKGRLAEMVGRAPQNDERDKKVAEPPQDGNTPGWLRNLLGGPAAGGILSGGLGDLIESFRQHGRGDAAESWVGKGANKPISATELEAVLGADKIQWLMEETGLSREELLAGLSRKLPETVDKLTPAGRLPTQDEAERLV